MRFSRLLMGALVAVGLTGAASGDASTKKFNWNPINGAQDTDVSDGTIVVSQVEARIVKPQMRRRMVRMMRESVPQITL